jgi:uncharacterized membrane protein YciS (DUF1049 family)
MTTIIDKVLNIAGWIIAYFIIVAFMYFIVVIAVVFHKNALGIYKLEREIQQIHQRLDQNTPIDKDDVQNGAEIG